ncbi:glycosylphosphatidylinositol anchor biosynthesis [Kickxella alabastrina]|nr:glycosylphosphatidylinositol anchor biosynthesis [Kickxella alabastrina]
MASRASWLRTPDAVCRCISAVGIASSRQHASFTSVDYATFHFARRIAGEQVAKWAVLCSAVSWSMGSGIVRPLVNSAETCLTAAGLVFWPWKRSTAHSLPKALLFASLSCIIRPTSGVVWLCAGLCLLVNQPRTGRILRTLRIVKTALMFGIGALAVMLVVDRLGYGQWVFPPYQFYVFNVQQDLATWFGESPPLYHLYVSLPVLFTSMLPFVLHGTYLGYQRGIAEPGVVAVLASAVFSLVGHMEYRFLYPLLPIGFVYAAMSMQSLAGPLWPSSSNEDSAHRVGSGRPWSVRRIVAYLLLTNVPATLYLNLVHQRGVIDVLSYLRRQPANDLTGIGFLMPCHSTPFYSHLHRNIPMWFLACEPPLDKSQLEAHYWEADDFEQRPADFLNRIFADTTGRCDTSLGVECLDEVDRHPRPGHWRLLPSHLVLYDNMAQRIRGTLKQLGYSEKKRFFNTHFEGDSRRKGDVVVYIRET